MVINWLYFLCGKIYYQKPNILNYLICLWHIKANAFTVCSLMWLLPGIFHHFRSECSYAQLQVCGRYSREDFPQRSLMMGGGICLCSRGLQWNQIWRWVKPWLCCIVLTASTAGLFNLMLQCCQILKHWTFAGKCCSYMFRIRRIGVTCMSHQCTFHLIYLM